MPLTPMTQTRRNPQGEGGLRPERRSAMRTGVEGLVRRSSVRSEGGFTILEVMIAATIILLVLVGLLSSLAKSQQLKQNTAEYQVALEAARNKFEQIQSTTFSQITATFNNTWFAVPGLLHENRSTSGTVNYTIPGRTNVGRVTVDSTNANLLLVTIDLQWIGTMSNVKGAVAQPQSYTLVTQLADRNR